MPRVTVCAAAVALAIGVSAVSHYRGTREATTSITADHQLATLEHRPFAGLTGTDDVPEMRSRILVPAAMKVLLAATPLSPVQAFVFLRAASACAMFLIVGWIAGGAGRPWYAPLLAMSLVALLLIVSFNHPLEFPSDFPDIAMTILFIEAARRDRRGLALAGSVVGAGFRESAAFAGIIWWFCAREPRPRRMVWSAVLAGAALCTTTALRFWFRLEGASVLNSIALPGSSAMTVRTFTEVWGLSAWTLGLLLYATILALWLAAARRWHALDAAALRAAAVLLAVTLVFGVIHELRIYMPVLAATLMAGLPDVRER